MTKVRAAKQIENQRRRGHRQQPRLLIALAVEMLIPGVERHREQAARLPLEALLGAVSLPDRGRAAAVKNVDQRLVHMSLRIETLSRRNADDIGVIHIAGAVEHDVDPVASDAIPPFERRRVEILDEKSADHVDSLETQSSDRTAYP